MTELSLPSTARRPRGVISATRECPACRDHLLFTGSGLGSSNRMFSHCKGCGSDFTLYGGMVSAVPPTSST